MRHVDPFFCEIGTLGQYLFHRFHIEKEILNYKSNREWFDVKLLRATGPTSDPTKAITDQIYGRQIKRAC